MRFVIALACASVCGCSLPTAAISPVHDRLDSGLLADASNRIDAHPGADAWAPDNDAQAGPDAWAADNDAYTPPNDAYTRPNDAYASPDAYVPPNDAYTPPVDAYTWRTCAQRYGGTLGYVGCPASSSTECEFYAVTNDTCTNVCTAVGGTCVDGWNNNGVGCTHGNHDGCDASLTDQICRCTRP